MKDLKKKDGPEAALSMRYCTTKKLLFLMSVETTTFFSFVAINLGLSLLLNACHYTTSFC
ncbi:MAG: hypothetical protein ABSE00_03785 [Chitinispirillaceae bacterium]|jgi:hypothetical protein